MAFLQAPNIFLPWYNTFGTLLQLSGDCKWCPVFSLTRFLLVLKSHMWRTGTPLKFWKEPLRGMMMLFCGCGLNFLNPCELPFLRQSPVIHFFWFNTLKGNTKAPIVDLLRLNNLRATQTALPGGGGTPLHGLYRYVRPQRVWFFSCFGHKLGIETRRKTKLKTKVQKSIPYLWPKCRQNG